MRYLLCILTNISIGEIQFRLSNQNPDKKSTGSSSKKAIKKQLIFNSWSQLKLNEKKTKA